MLAPAAGPARPVSPRFVQARAGWLPSGEERGEVQEEQFWFVHHDGDAEDLDEDEVKKIFKHQFKNLMDLYQ